MERIRWKAPYPLLRHHFGRPTVDETLAGVVDIARAECFVFKALVQNVIESIVG